ncbi:MAG: hypothetical protein GXY08_07165 [Ruminococcus sp.]|nr:hypothetical protein [Ruminococcus sp.]
MKAVGAVETDDLSFIVTIRGNIEQRFKDIQVKGVKRVSSDMFPEDNILSQFILPDIQSDDVERIGNDLYGFCADKGLFVNYKLHIEKLVSDGMIYFAPLPNNCLGRVILSVADVEIIKNVQTEDGLKPKKCTIRATHGTILLNYKKYAEEMDGGLRITVAHELVHTLFHDRFLKLLQLLGEEKVELHSSTETVALDENMSDIQKALRIAESQADVLAMPLVIPKITVDAAIQEIATDPSTHYANYGDRMQACVNKFAKLYGVSVYIAKDRLRQLGYDFVDGTCLEYEENGRKIHPAPFYFQPRKLKGNETFVIDRNNYERLLRENKEFSELINNGRYIYLGYVVCMLSSKYVAVSFNSDDAEFVLTDYAREHADECLIKFRYKKIANTGLIYSDHITSYLSKMPEFNKVEIESFKICDSNKELDEKIIDDMKNYVDVINELKSQKYSTFANTLVLHMRKNDVEEKILSFRTSIDVTLIRDYYKGKKIPSEENVMALCIGLKLHPDFCYDMFEKANYFIKSDNPKHLAYRFLFNYTSKSIGTCNAILEKLGQKPVPKKNNTQNNNPQKNKPQKKKQVSNS